MVKTLRNRIAAFAPRHYGVLMPVLLLALFYLEGCRNKPTETHLLFTGDILLSRNVLVEMEQHRSFPWKNISSRLGAADFVMGNLEGAVGSGISHPPSPGGSPVFDIPTRCIPLLKQAGFAAVSVENNHSLDLGDSGKANTITELTSAGVAPVYYDNSPRFFKVHDIVVGIVSINLVPGYNYQRQQIPSLEIKQKLRLADSLANMVVVFIHWGSELLEWPDNYQRSSAAWLVDNGADLIIGCHPHVIQQPEMVHGKPVFFSVGNHLFDQKYEDSKEGLMVDCNIRKGYFNCSGVITRTAKNSFFPEVSDSVTYKFPSIALRNTMKIAGLSVVPVSVTEAGKSKLKLEFWNEGKKRWQTSAMSIVSIAASRLDGKNDFLITLEKHYSDMDNEVSLRPYVYSVEKDGLVSRWRGSALAWPLLDAVISKQDNRVLCALHRGDSFVDLDPLASNTRVQAYRWNGFGFSGIESPEVCDACNEYFK